MKIVIYSNPNCGPCIATKSALKRAGVEYTEGNTAEAAETLRSFGFSSAPVVIVHTESGTHGWNGYRPDLIGKLVAGVPAGARLPDAAGTL